MNDIEGALRTLPESLDLEPRGDLVASVRRTHRRRTVRRRSIVAGVALATLGISLAPTLLARSDRDAGVDDAASGAPAAGPVTKASLDASLAALAAGPGADAPAPTGSFAYTHSRTRHLAMVGAGGSTEAEPAVPASKGAAAAEQPAPPARDANAAAEEPAPPARDRAPMDAHAEEMFSYLYGTERHIWLDKLSGGHLVAKPLAPKFLHAGDEVTYRRVVGAEEGMDLALTNGGEPVNVPNPSFDPAALPTDPAAMRQYLQDVPSGVEDLTERTFTAGADLLRERVLPLKVRVAVLRALLLIPDVAVAEGVADLDGRTGIGIGRVDRGTTLRQLIVDAAGTILGERDTVAVAGEFGPVGTVIGHTAVLESGYVDKIGIAPSGAQIPLNPDAAPPSKG